MLLAQHLCPNCLFAPSSPRRSNETGQSVRYGPSKSLPREPAGSHCGRHVASFNPESRNILPICDLSLVIRPKGDLDEPTVGSEVMRLLDLILLSEEKDCLKVKLVMITRNGDGKGADFHSDVTQYCCITRFDHLSCLAFLSLAAARPFSRFLFRGKQEARR